jgi:hypothetical protein
MSGGMGGGEGGVDPPTTTKGDVSGYDTTFARIPIGSDTQVLTADSAQALGLKWATPTDVQPPTTTKGDLSGFSTAQARIPIGSDTQVLTADSAQALGLKWAAPASAGGTVLLQEVVMGTSAATLSSTVTLDKSLYGSFIVTGNFSPLTTSSTTLRMRVNNSTAAGQLVNGSIINGATQTDFQSSDTSFRISNIGFTWTESTNVNLIFNQSSINRGYFMAFGYSAWEGAGTNTRLDHMVDSAMTAAVTSVDFFWADGSLFETGNWLTITGVLR